MRVALNVVIFDESTELTMPMQEYSCIRITNINLYS